MRQTTSHKNIDKIYHDKLKSFSNIILEDQTTDDSLAAKECGIWGDAEMIQDQAGFYSVFSMVCFVCA